MTNPSNVSLVRGALNRRLSPYSITCIRILITVYPLRGRIALSVLQHLEEIIGYYLHVQRQPLAASLIQDRPT